MRIMGIDPSITCTGVSLPDQTTFAVKPRSEGDARLREIADRVRSAVLLSKAELAVVEGLGGVYKGEAARVIPMVHGVIRLELMRLGVPYVALSPYTLKKFATGATSADKTAMALAALKRLGREYATSDECDADWCRVAGRMAYGLGQWVESKDGWLTMPQDQLAALRWAGTGKARHEIAWPQVGAYSPWPTVQLRA
jgi:Holliday junction resolvasome RuvABC endonuclease subunit